MTAVADPLGLYARLGVPVDAPAASIKKAYHRKALQTHPDKVAESERDGATRQFQQLQQAFEVLNCPDKRERYDSRGLIDESDEDIDHMDVMPVDLLMAMFGGGMFPGTFVIDSDDSLMERRATRGVRVGKPGRRKGGRAKAPHPGMDRKRRRAQRQRQEEHVFNMMGDPLFAEEMFAGMPGAGAPMGGLGAMFGGAPGGAMDEDMMGMVLQELAEPVEKGGRLHFRCQLCQKTVSTSRLMEAHLERSHADVIDEMLGGMGGMDPLMEMMFAGLAAGPAPKGKGKGKKRR